MSYRHSSYRKVRKIARQAEDSPGVDFWTHTQRERIRLWGGWRPEPKPEGWGVPRRKRASV